MASIYRDKKSGYWYINYITPDGRRVRKSLGTKDRKLAELALKDFEVQLAKGKLGFVMDVPLSDFLEYYLKWSKATKAKRTYEAEVNACKKLLEFVEPTVKLSKITKQRVEAFKAFLIEKGYSRTYANIILRHLKAIFQKAVEWNYVETNPFKVPLFKTEEKVRYLTPDKLSTFFSFINNPLHKAIIAFLFYTGLRLSEACNLLWEQVNLEEGYITVKNRRDYRTKTYKERIIPISSHLYPYLLTLQQHKKNEKVIPLSYYSVAELFKRYSKKSKIHCSPHMLRHSFATMLASNNVSIKAIQELLGHSSVKTTEIYAKFAKDYLKDIVQKLNIPL